MADQDNADRDGLRGLIHDEIFNQPVKTKRRKRAKSAIVRPAAKLVSDSEEEDNIEIQARFHAHRVHVEVTTPTQDVLGLQRHQDGKDDRKPKEEPKHTSHQIDNRKEQPNKDGLHVGETSLEQQARRRHTERIFRASSVADSVDNELYDNNNIQAKGLKTPEPLPWSPEPQHSTAGSYSDDFSDTEENEGHNTSYDPSWTPLPSSTPTDEALFQTEIAQDNEPTHPQMVPPMQLLKPKQPQMLQSVELSTPKQPQMLKPGPLQTLAQPQMVQSMQPHTPVSAHMLPSDQPHKPAQPHMVSPKELHTPAELHMVPLEQPRTPEQPHMVPSEQQLTPAQLHMVPLEQPHTPAKSHMVSLAQPHTKEKQHMVASEQPHTQEQPQKLPLTSPNNAQPKEENQKSKETNVTQDQPFNDTRERRQGDVKQEEASMKPPQTETLEQSKGPKQAMNKNVHAVIGRQRPKTGFRRDKQSGSKFDDEESDEDEDPSLAKLQFHLVLRMADLPEDELCIRHYFMKEGKEEVIIIPMVHEQNFSLQGKELAYFICKCQFELKHLKDRIKKEYRYSLDGEYRRTITLNWDPNALEPVLHHYDGLIRPAGDIALLQEVARLMLPSWKSLKGDTNSAGVSAATFIQQIKQVDQQCIQFQLKNPLHQKQVFSKYVDIKLTQLKKMMEDETWNMRAVISSLIIVYIAERHGLDFNRLIQDLLCFLSAKPTGEWLQMFDTLQKIHFSHDVLASILTERLIWFIRIIMAEKNSTVFEILQLLCMLHFIMGENLIEMDHSTTYSVEWWGFSNLGKSVMTVIERMTKSKQERLLKKDQLKTLLDLSAHDPILKRSMVFLVNRIDLEQFADQMPISILIAKWRRLEDKEDYIWMLDVVSRSLKNNNNSDCSPEEIRMLAECGLDAIKLTDNLWEMLLQLKIKDVHDKSRWNDFFKSLFQKLLQETPDLATLGWFCHQFCQNMIGSIPEEWGSMVKERVHNICHQRGRENQIVDYLYNKVDAKGFKEQRINWVALQVLISQHPIYLKGAIKDETCEKNLEIIAKTRKNVKMPNEMETLTEEVKQVCQDLENGNINLNGVYRLLDNRQHFVQVVKHLNELHWVECNLPLNNLLDQCVVIMTQLKQTRKLLACADRFIYEIEPVETDIFKRNDDFKPTAIQLKDLVNWPLDEEEHVEIRYFNLSNELKKMFEDMEKLNPSIVFHNIWIDVKSALDKNSNVEEILPISMDNVLAKVWHPAVQKWEKLKKDLKNRKILIRDVKYYFLDLEDQVLDAEIQIMAGRKHQEKSQELQGVLRLFYLQKILEVLNDLQTKYEYNVEVHTLHVDGDQSLKEAKGILENFEKSTKANINDITRDQLESICVYIKCIKVVKWIQVNVQNELEVKNLIDIAMASVKGHGAHEMQRAVCLRSAINGYAPLLFLKTDGVDFESLICYCRKVFQNVEKDPNIPKNLDTVNGFLPWLKTIRGSQGSEASNDMERIGRILRDSEIKIGDKSQQILQHGNMLTLEDIIQVKVTEKDHEEEFRNSDLIDMQSKVMLLVGTDEQQKDERQNIETYEEILECLQRIGNMFIYSQNIGNLALHNFLVKIINKNNQSNVHLTMGTGTKRSRWPTAEVSNQLHNIANCLEECVSEWNRYLRFCREKFYHLNYFQTRQLTIMRKVLARNNVIQFKDLMLFYPVKYQCQENDIVNAKEAAKRQRMKAKGFAFEKYTTKEGEFNTKLADLYDSVCSSYEKDEPCLSLTYIGFLLEKLAKDSTKHHHNMKQIPTLKTGEPNLIALTSDEILFTLLSLYKESSLEGNEQFPSANEVLFCTEHTTVEEVCVFWRRAINNEAVQQLFCLANADMMPFDVADKVVQELEELKELKNYQCEYQLVVLCAIDGNNLSHLQTCLESYKRNIVIQDLEILKAFVRGKLCGSANDNQYSVKMVMSEKAGMGKSLLIRNSASSDDTYVKIPIFSRHIKEHELTSHLLEHEELSSDRKFVIHIDLHHDIYQSMDRILFLLTIAGRVETTDGYIWCPLPNHNIMVENQPLMIDNDAQKFYLKILNVLPMCVCHPPQDSLDRNVVETAEGDQYINEEQFRNFLLTVFYLNQINKNQPVRFTTDENLVNGLTSPQALRIALQHCGIDACSWAELVYFLQFMKQQFEDCSDSFFCSIGSTDADDLPRFNEFVLRFLSDMAKDFSTRSIEISEQSLNKDEKKTLPGLQLKRKWEDSSHPYLFFNEDRETFSFMGFIVENFDLKDPTGKILTRKIMQQGLFEALVRNGVDLKQSFEVKNRQLKLDTLHKIIGGTNADPDPSFVLTADNVKKILAIDMRFRCGIPVVIMGETGCGKTRLVNFLCSLKLPANADQKQKKTKKPGKQNMIIVKVHGGTTKEHIYKAVDDADKKANENKFDTVLFFDEANTTSEIGLLKEIICDHSMRGKRLDNKHLRIIAAVNPYRRHSPEMIENIEQSGLGYHISAEETTEKLGLIPMRQLVYRVQRLPERMVHLVWDFGQLDEANEYDYIQNMVIKELSGIADASEVKIITTILAKAQLFMRDQKHECKFVSLRDVERTLHVLLWFYEHQDPLFKLMDGLEPEINERDYKAPAPLTRSLILSLGVCYMASLSNKKAFPQCINQYFEKPCTIPKGTRIRVEIRRCMDVFMNNVDVSPSIAKNFSLKENIFMMIMCIELRIPLFVVGRPGSSKSLAKTIVMDVMQGVLSKSDLFKTFKEIQMISYQCSPMSTPDGIVNVFRQCAAMQKHQDLDKFTGVTVLDEIGLAEDSPKMPLKSLHPLLEDGCDGNEKVQPYKKVAFLGISNWALDPAKMNRGILVKRNEPEKKELEKTARGIAKGFQKVSAKLEKYYKIFAEAYHELYKSSSEKKEFFGLRDFYSFVKMVCSSAKSKSDGEELTWIDVHYAILRNFGGLESVDPVYIFRERLRSTEIPNSNEDLACTEFELIHAGLKGEGLEGVESLSRYTLVMVENLGALEILQNYFMDKDTVILFGSSFPKDQEYTQICRNINRIKICMETGQKVILLNMDNLYESLYDCLNQYYIKLGGDNFVDLGLGTHRIKCQVHKDFRITLVAEKLVVYTSYPIALVNRLEKHFLLTRSILKPGEKQLVQELKQWVHHFVSSSADTKKINVEEVFIGYHQDAVATTLLQLCQDYDREDLSEQDMMELKEKCKKRLLQCVTPDSVLRLALSELKPDADRLTKIYFNEQPHDGLIKLVQAILTGNNGYNASYSNLAMVTTHSRLLTQKKLEKVKRELGDVDLVWMSLHQFDTEHQFRKMIQRESEKNRDKRPLIYLVQCELGHFYQNLIASSRYVLWNEYQKLDRKYQVVMILTIQLPRRSDILFSGFSGGKWTSFHIDELLENQHMEMDLAEVRKLTICELFSEARLRPKIIDFDKIIIEATYKASTKIVEHQHNLDRKMGRTLIVTDLIQSNPEFNRLLKYRLVLLIQEKYESKRLLAADQNFEKQWLTKKVCDIDNVTRLSSLRIAIWNHLVDELVLPLAGMLCFMDTNNNLDFFKPGSKKQFLRPLWLNIFKDGQASPIIYDEYFKTTADQGSVEKSFFQTTYTSLDKVRFHSEFPFSFLMMMFINNALQQPDVKELEKDLVHGKICERLFGFPLGKIIETATEEVSNKQLCQCYLQDYLKMMYLPASPNTAEVEFKIIAETIRQKMNHFTLVEVHLIYQDYISDFTNFKTILESSECTSDELEKYCKNFQKKRNKSTNVFLGEMMLHFLLEQLSPDENDLLPENELIWTHKVEACSLAVETTLQSIYQEKNEGLQDIKLRWKSLMLLKSYVFNISLEFSKRTDAIQPIRFWKVIKELHKQHSKNIQKLTIKELHQQHSKHIQKLTTEMLLGVETVIKDSNAALVIQVLGKKAKIVCDFCRDCVYHPVDLPCGHKFCKICLQRNLIITDQRMVYSCVAKKCGSRFQKVVFDQFPSQKMKELFEGQDTLRERCQRFFCYFLSEILFEIAIHNEDVQSRQVTEKLARMFSERKTVNVLLDSPQNEDVILSFTMHQLLNKRYEATEKQLEGWLYGLNFSAGNLFERRFNRKAVVLLANCLEERELLKIKTDDPNCIRNKLLQSIKSVADFLRTNVQLSFQALKYAARFRVILTELAGLLHARCIDRKNSHPNLQKIMEKAEEICSNEKYEVCGHFLARSIFRKHGKISLSTICESFHWIFDLRETQQNDVFAVVGGNYVTCRTAVIDIYMKYKSSDAQKFIQNNTSLPVLYRVLLAINQEVVIKPMRNNSYGKYKLYKDRIAEFLNSPKVKAILKYNQKVWADDNLYLQPDTLLPRNVDHDATAWQIVELLQHFKLTVDLTQNNLFQPLKDMVFNPGNLKNMYLPGMPEDEVYKQVLKVLKQRNAMGNDQQDYNITIYECPNGHVYTIGNCGKANGAGRCWECNAVVGGKAYDQIHEGSKNIGNRTDQTKYGYCLGISNERKDNESVRIYSSTITAILRLIVHLAMYNGTLYQLQIVRQLIQVPNNVGDVKRFLWDHLVKDLDILAANLHKSRDDVCVIIHLLLSQIQGSQGNWNQNWINQDTREQWEANVVNGTIKPLLDNVDNSLKNAEQAILNAGRESSKLETLYETNIPHDEEKAGGFGHPFSMPELWGYRNHVTIEDMRVKMEHANHLPNTEILQLFCQKLQDLVLLRDLPAILSLQQKLCRRFHLVYSSAQADEKPVNQFLESLDNDLERREYESQFQSFIRVWQIIHTRLQNFPFRVKAGEDPISLPQENCLKDCTKDSPISMFMPNESGLGMCSFVVVRFLVKIQNDFIDDYAQKRHITPVEKEVNGRSISDKFVISFTEDKELLPLVHANASYSTELGAGLKLSYDFLNIQAEVEDRFIKNKPLLKLKVSFIAYREDYQTDRARLLRLNTVIPQESLAEYRKQLEADAKRMILVDLNNVLYVLDIALGYVVSMGISEEMRQISLQDFVSNKLQLNEDMDIGVMQRLQLRHAKYVWLHLSLERAKMLMDMKQDPLPHLDKSYRDPMNKHMEDQLKQIVTRNFQVAAVLELLYEFCLLFIGKVNLTDPNYVDDSNFPLGYSLDLYQDEKDYKGPNVGFDDNGFLADILHKHVWSAFHTVYAVYKKQRK